jgi:hypothetical protein
VREAREARQEIQIPNTATIDVPAQDDATPGVKASRSVRRSIHMVRAAHAALAEIPADVLEELAQLRDEIDTLLDNAG